MVQKSRISYLILGLIALTTMLSILVWADASYPFGARSIDYITSSRANESSYPAASIEAQAGNVTELSLVGISVTKAWQGYYGNITGEITLEDTNGNVFYNWTSAEPKGQIYAANATSVSWANIRCFNWSDDDGFQLTDLEAQESIYNIGDDAADGINETFYDDDLDSDVYIGSLNLTGNATALGITCHTTNPFQYSYQNTNLDNFENFLLADGTGLMIFGGVLENNEFNNISDQLGFDNQLHDFQLMVAEDGHIGSEDFTTTYYFWLELR